MNEKRKPIEEEEIKKLEKQYGVKIQGLPAHGFGDDVSLDSPKAIGERQAQADMMENAFEEEPIEGEERDTKQLREARAKNERARIDREKEQDNKRE